MKNTFFSKRQGANYDKPLIFRVVTCTLGFMRTIKCLALAYIIKFTMRTHKIARVISLQLKSSVCCSHRQIRPLSLSRSPLISHIQLLSFISGRSSHWLSDSYKFRWRRISLYDFFAAFDIFDAVLMVSHAGSRSDCHTRAAVARVEGIITIMPLEEGR